MVLACCWMIQSKDQQHRRHQIGLHARLVLGLVLRPCSRSGFPVLNQAQQNLSQQQKLPDHLQLLLRCPVLERR